MGKFLIISGIILIVIGVLIQFAPKIPLLGKLPGDFYFVGRNFRIYFPLASAIVLSILISLVMLLINKAKH